MSTDIETIDDDDEDTVPGTGTNVTVTALAESYIAPLAETSTAAAEVGVIAEKSEHAIDPFLIFSDTSPLNATQKSQMISIHPIQPTSHPGLGSKLDLPFDVDRVYVRENGARRQWLSYSVKSKKF